MAWLRSAVLITFALGVSASPPWGTPAKAQWAAKPAPGSPPAPAAADHTTATFGDWTLRCDRRTDLTPPKRVCEIGLAIQKGGESGVQAQVAVGRIAAGQPLRLTAVLPPNVALKTTPSLVLDGQQPSSTVLSWTRCIAGACFADAEISPGLLDVLRSRSQPARLDYRDATEREVSQPVSLRGLRDAIDALVREEAR